jgi:hypothetical protein
VAKLAHRSRLNLTNSLTREIHLGAYILERPNLAGTIKSESHAKDLLLALVKGLQQLLDCGRHHLDRGDVKG